MRSIKGASFKDVSEDGYFGLGYIVRARSLLAPQGQFLVYSIVVAPDAENVRSRVAVRHHGERKASFVLVKRKLWNV